MEWFPLHYLPCIFQHIWVLVVIIPIFAVKETEAQKQAVVEGQITSDDRTGKQI